MQIVAANKSELNHALKLAAQLTAWFNHDGLKNMAVDFRYNHLLVAKDANQILGFINYTTYSVMMLLLWIGVKEDHQRQGIGKQLLHTVEDIAKELDLYAMEVETLPEQVDYEPYQRTRNFYYQNGFKEVLYKPALIEGWDDQVVLLKKIK